jgi:hypothetical protein
VQDCNCMVVVVVSHAIVCTRATAQVKDDKAPASLGQQASQHQRETIKTEPQLRLHESMDFFSFYHAYPARVLFSLVVVVDRI